MKHINIIIAMFFMINVAGAVTVNIDGSNLVPKANLSTCTGNNATQWNGTAGNCISISTSTYNSTYDATTSMVNSNLDDWNATYNASYQSAYDMVFANLINWNATYNASYDGYASRITQLEINDTTAILASNVTNTPAGSISATNVQTAINELGAEKLNKSGDTMTGDFIISKSTANVVMQGIESDPNKAELVFRNELGGASAREWRIKLSDDYGSGTNRLIVLYKNDAGNYVEFMNLDRASSIRFNGLIFPQQAATASAPAYVEGGVYYDTTLHKLRIGGAAGWETVTSV